MAHTLDEFISQTKNKTINMSNNNYTKEDIERMRIAMEGETTLDRIKRKAKEEPLVPAGKIGRLFDCSSIMI